MNETQDYFIEQSLLKQVNAIIEKHEEIAKITGEWFNIFEILGVEWKETQLHCKFLAHLLDPKGSHGKGSIFLKSFLETVLKVSEENFTPENAVIKIEHPFSFEEDNGWISGRIDIIISSQKREQNPIIIENKIEARDQDRQLERYAQFKPYGKPPRLFYLTLWKSEPSEESLGYLSEVEFQKKYGVVLSKITYEKNILEWLELKCLPVTYDHIGLNKVIQQYALTIRNITNQSRSKEMEKELAKIMAQPQNVKAAFQIAGALESMKKELFDKVLLAQISEGFLNIYPNKFLISEAYNSTEGGSLSCQYMDTHYHIQAWYWDGSFLIAIYLEDFKNDVEEHLAKCNQIWELEGLRINEFLNKEIQSNSNLHSDGIVSWRNVMWTHRLNISFSTEMELWNAVSDGRISLEFKSEMLKVIDLLDKFFTENPSMSSNAH